MTISILEVRFEHHREALGIQETVPRISWSFDGNVVDWQQSAYEIEVVHEPANVLENFKVSSSQSSLVPWPTSPLRSGVCARVRVRAHGQLAQSSTLWSRWYSVEAGLLDQEDWNGAMPIGSNRNIDKDKPKRPLYFRKNFVLSHGRVRAARLYITAQGLYEAYINGHRVGDHVLAPGWQSYDNRHVYNTFDITDLLLEGNNTIGCIVGEGWYSGRIFSLDPLKWRNHWGDKVGLLACVSINFLDGFAEHVITDSSWTATEGPILSSEIYNGETYDSRLEARFKDWTTHSYQEEEQWKPTTSLAPLKGVLQAPVAPPCRKIEEIKPTLIWVSPQGKLLVDFGQNFAGWVRLKASGNSGDEVVITHAEVIERGELALEPLRSARAQDRYILNGDRDQVLEPHFTFHGFRYIQVDGLPNGAVLTEFSLTGVVIHSDLEETGHFHCDNPLLNQFHANVRWSMKSNFISVPTDCPQRDERVGWTGDVTAFAATSNFLYDCSGFWKGWHQDVWAEMNKTGLMMVPFYVPTTAPARPNNGIMPPASTAMWGDVTVMGPWQSWLAYGDLSLLEEQYQQAQSWIDHGVVRQVSGLWEQSGFQFGDWLDPSAPESTPDQATTNKYLVADAYLIGMTDLLNRMSTLLQKTTEAAKYEKQSDDLRRAFALAWLTEDGQLLDRTQTAYSLALYFDLFTDRNHRAQAASTLLDILSENDFFIGTGFAGTWTLGHAFRKIGRVKDFYLTLLQTGNPSWLYQVIKGGTTTWERWDSLLADGTVNGCGMTSFNHYAIGSVADWIHQVVGGLAPASPGWRNILVSPMPGGNMMSAEVSHKTSYGTIELRWWIEKHADKAATSRNGFHLSIKIPPNCRAQIIMPGSRMEFEVGSGSYQYFDSEYRVGE